MAKLKQSKRITEAKQSESDWMTIAEAKEHLRVKFDYINDRLVPVGPEHYPGKIRYMKVRDGGRRNLPRLLRADVYALLPRAETLLSKNQYHLDESIDLELTEIETGNLNREPNPAQMYRRFSLDQPA